LQRARTGVAVEAFERMAAAHRRRAGRLQHRGRHLGRGRAGQQLGPPHPAVGLGVAGSGVDPAGRLEHGQVGGGHRGVGAADPGPHGRQVGQLALVDVLDRGVHRGPRHAHVDGRVAGHHPVRRELGHHQGQPLHPAEQRPGRHGDVDVQVVRGGRAHAERVPGRLDPQPVPGRHQELRHLARVGDAAGGDQVGVRVPGARAERLGALDPVTAVDRPVGRRHLREPRADAALAHRHRVPGAPGGGPQVVVAGLQRLGGQAQRLGELVGDGAERAGDRGVHVEDQRGRAVSAGQLVRDSRVVREARARPAQPLRRHQPEETGPAQVVEVVGGKRAVPVVRGRPRREPWRQPPGLLDHERSPSLRPVPW
jgi:hypothetical protein